MESKAELDEIKESIHKLEINAENHHTTILYMAVMIEYTILTTCVVIVYIINSR